VIGLANVAGHLAGIEEIFPVFDGFSFEFLLGLARAHGLLVTGGSDFHGIRPNELDLGGVYVPIKAVRRLREAWEGQKRTPGREPAPEMGPGD
jgi:hypothetical protein